jgi:glutathione synthase/RimK-type ligase-like ATP-grasp enzyme
VVPSTLITSGSPSIALESAVRDLIDARGSCDIIVKPAVSIGGIGMLRATREGSATAHAISLCRRGDVILQPFQADILTEGETSLIFLMVASATQ